MHAVVTRILMTAPNAAGGAHVVSSAAYSNVTDDGASAAMFAQAIRVLGFKLEHAELGRVYVAERLGDDGELLEAWVGGRF